MAQPANQLRQQGDLLSVSGALTLDTVPALEEALSSLQPGIRRVDLAGVDRVDSSALAWLLELCRLSAGGPPEFLHVPQNLRTLAQLYELDFLDFSPKKPENAA